MEFSQTVGEGRAGGQDDGFCGDVDLDVVSIAVEKNTMKTVGEEEEGKDGGNYEGKVKLADNSPLLVVTSGTLSVVLGLKDRQMYFNPNVL